VPHGLDDVAAAGFALAADHRGAFGDAPQGLAEVARAADERHVVAVLGAVILVVGRGQHFGFIDEVDADRLEHLGLGDVADAHLGHDRNRHRVHDLGDQVEVAHPRDAARRPDIGRDPFERHHGDRARLLSDDRLFGRDDVHDHAALEHLRQTALDRDRPGLFLRVHPTYCPRDRPTVQRRRPQGDVTGSGLSPGSCETSGKGSGGGV